jgi:hypothetical protein
LLHTIASSCVGQGSFERGGGRGSGKEERTKDEIKRQGTIDEMEKTTVSRCWMSDEEQRGGAWSGVEDEIWAEQEKRRWVFVLEFRLISINQVDRVARGRPILDKQVDQ